MSEDGESFQSYLRVGEGEYLRVGEGEWRVHKLFGSHEATVAVGKLGEDFAGDRWRYENLFCSSS